MGFGGYEAKEKLNNYHLFTFQTVTAMCVVVQVGFRGYEARENLIICSHFKQSQRCMWWCRFVSGTTETGSVRVRWVMLVMLVRT